MAGSSLGLIYFKKVLSGAMSSAALETALANADDFDAFTLMCSYDRIARKLLENPLSRDIVLSSDTALDAFIKGNPRIIGGSEFADIVIRDTDLCIKVLKMRSILEMFVSNSATYSYLKSAISTNGVKLRTQNITNTGVYAFEDPNVKAAVFFAVGPPGLSSNSVSNNVAGNAGGGGEFVSVLLEGAAIPLIIDAQYDQSQPFTTPSIITGVLTAAAGNSATTTVGGHGTGGGINENGGADNIFNIDHTNTPIPLFKSFRVKGGDGGDGASVNGENGTPGGDGAGIGGKPLIYPLTDLLKFKAQGWGAAGAGGCRRDGLNYNESNTSSPYGCSSNGVHADGVASRSSGVGDRGVGRVVYVIE